MDVRVIIVYSDELEAIMVDDMKMEDISVIQEKQINEWFYPSNGRDGWEGLIKEIQKMIADENANLKFEFQGPEEYKKVFSSCIEKLGYGIECMKDEEIASFHTEEAKKDEHRGLYKEAIKHYYLGANVGKSVECQFKVAEYYFKHYLGEIDLGEVDKEAAIKKAIDYYEKAANAGNIEAQYQLYKIFISDEYKPLKKDYDSALKWLNRVAVAGNAEAQIQMGDHLYKVDGTEEDKDCKKAFEWYMKAAEKNNDVAYARIARAYKDGIGVKEDLNKAYEWYGKAANAGNAEAQIEMGDRLYKIDGTEDDEDCKKAFEWYMQAAEQKNNIAYMRIARAYKAGIGVKEDLNEAYEWYDKAAKDGNIRGIFRLGECYYFGRGVEKDEKRAVELFRQAAENDQPDASDWLGQCYEYGYGIDKDIDEAERWYKRTEELDESGSGRIQLKLGLFYEVTKKDFESAYEWYNKAAEMGNSAGQCCFGACFQWGKGTEKNYVEAVKWYKCAIDNGSALAMFYLGQCYELGIGVEKNNQTAFEWYKKAADADEPDPDACYKIAQEYYKNIDTDTKVLGRTSALVALSVLVPVTNLVTIPAALLGSGMVGESKKKKFVQTEAGKEMMKYYHRAADLGHAEAKKKVDDLKEYEK